MKKYQLLHGNCLNKLKELEDNSVDAIVTDPPYGLSFMGNKWDYDVPSQVIWTECFRVLKQGGHLLSFSGSRTYHRMTVRIEDAGFEIRDQIMWIYGGGFPKSHNIGKAVDKKACAEAKQWEGWGTALKPAHEPIVMARKPFKGTVANNVLEHGVGGINIDGCRIGLSKSELGRFPANLILDEEAGRILDMQSGIIKSGIMKKGSKRLMSDSPNQNTYGHWKPHSVAKDTYGDKGGASRFFYCPRANKKDRENGNNHPTVKPTNLMAYLVRLVTPKGGVVLDPFMGSGSTGKACAIEGMQFIGIEREQEYLDIAKARIERAYNPTNPKLF